MQDIIIYGAGGLAKEIAQLIEDINAVEPKWNIKGFIDDFKGNCGEIINGYKILGTGEVLANEDKNTNVILGLGDPNAKKKLYDKIKSYGLKYPVLIHPTAKVAPSVSIGKGSIIGIHSIVLVNTVIGNHVLLNTKSFVAHDVVIKDFTNCSVNSLINGNVIVNECALIGANSVIMEKKVIGKNVKISMGSVVMFDVEDNYIVMTKPSKSVTLRTLLD